MALSLSVRPWLLLLLAVFLVLAMAAAPAFGQQPIYYVAPAVAQQPVVGGVVPPGLPNANTGGIVISSPVNVQNSVQQSNVQWVGGLFGGLVPLRG